MRFDVKRRASYTLTNESIKAFKTAMLEYLEEEMYDSGELREDEGFPYTINDISDDIVREALTDVIQDAFEYNDCYQGGVYFDDYFGSVSLECGEDDVSDAVYEAVALLRTKMEV